jgi:hypothetical protein
MDVREVALNLGIAVTHALGADAVVAAVVALALVVARVLGVAVGVVRGLPVVHDRPVVRLCSGLLVAEVPKVLLSQLCVPSRLGIDLEDANEVCAAGGSDRQTLLPWLLRLRLLAPARFQCNEVEGGVADLGLLARDLGLPARKLGLPARDLGLLARELGLLARELGLVALVREVRVVGRHRGRATAIACLLLLLLRQPGAAAANDSVAIAQVREERASRASARGAQRLRLRLAAVAASPPKARLTPPRTAVGTPALPWMCPAYA